MKTGIVCEGGGMRGVFTAGVLHAFMQAGFVADELVGVSAGASNGASYVSGQMGRGLRTNVDYVGDARYCGLKSFVRTGSVFGMDFIFGEIPDVLDPFDFEAFAASPCDFYAGAVNVESGATTWFGKADVAPGLFALRASCSMPVFSPIVPFKGGHFLDGGVSDPIPVQKALNDGCTKLVVILTRERGFEKKPQGLRAFYHAKYRRYPNLVRAMDLRHLRYNHQLAQVAKLEAAGTAVVVAPPAPLAVGRFGQNREALVAAFGVGLAEGERALALL